MLGERDVVAEVTLSSAPVRVEDVVAVASGAHVALSAETTALLGRSRAVVETALASGKPVYGLNTRLGAGRDTVLTPTEITQFQRRVIANHEGGIGQALPAIEARALTFARLAGLSRGGSGVRPQLAEAYAALLNAGVTPVVPSRGSVGAGDLTHLAAVAAVVIGTGQAASSDGQSVVPGASALADAGLEPFELAAGEGLASISSNAYSVGVGALTVRYLERLADAADRAVALSLEALGQNGSGGNLSPFDPAIQTATGRAEQAAVAASILQLLDGSALTAGSGRRVSVQDPLSFRTVPQLHGAVRGRIRSARVELEIELNARSENPLVDVDSGQMLSGGNFEIVALALEFEALRLAVAQLAAASERRIALLSELSVPLRAAGTAKIPGLLWYSAAANLAEIRQLAQPVSTSVTTLSGVEDQATQAPLALQLLQRSVVLTEEILAIEALHATQLLDLDAGAGTGVDTDAGLGVGTEPLARSIQAVLGAGVPASALVTVVTAILGNSS